MPAPLVALIRALLVWLLIMLGESVHGALRRLLYSDELMLILHQASVLVGAAIVFAVTWVCLPWLKLRSARGALAVGVFWVALTLVFEVGLGRTMGTGWREIFAEYDLSRGGVMLLGLAAMALTPWLVRRLQAGRRVATPGEPR